ncbi:MAG: hypothetical protein HYW51_01740 [Candidatus Doudnabacteria bacterium]|nr:hypothetical protein [Candidatus Doudnabacteria bacterium]
MIAFMQRETGRVWGRRTDLAEELGDYEAKFGEPPWAEEFRADIDRRGWMPRPSSPVFVNDLETETEELVRKMLAEDGN